MDRQGGNSQVAKSDLKALDPAWKGKVVVWKDIKESKDITLEDVEERFADKTKPKAAAVVDTGTVDLNKPKTFFAPDKGQQLFIVLSRVPPTP